MYEQRPRLHLLLARHSPWMLGSVHRRGIRRCIRPAPAGGIMSIILPYSPSGVKIGAAITFLLLVASCAIGAASSDPVSKEDRRMVLLHTCFPGGWYDGRLEECRRFKEVVIAEANGEQRAAMNQERVDLTEGKPND